MHQPIDEGGLAHVRDACDEQFEDRRIDPALVEVAPAFCHELLSQWQDTLEVAAGEDVNEEVGMLFVPQTRLPRLGRIRIGESGFVEKHKPTLLSQQLLKVVVDGSFRNPGIPQFEHHIHPLELRSELLLRLEHVAGIPVDPRCLHS